MDTTTPDSAGSCIAEDGNPTAILVVLVIGTFLAPLDSSIVNIALPAMADYFDVRLSAVGWVATAYLLAIAALVLSMGRLGDIKGLKRIYIWGFAVFGIGSVFCAFAWSLPALIGARVIQAAGASMMLATGPALITRTFPSNRRGWALGWMTLAVSAGLTVGPVLGGFLLSVFSWQSIFLINVPLAVIVIIAARRLLPTDCPQPESFDIPGAVTAGLALTLLLTGMSQIDRQGITSPFVVGSFVAAVLLGVAFVAIERRVEHPMVDLRLFESRRFSAGLATPLFAYMAIFAVTFTMPFYLLSVRGLNPAVAGVILTATPLAMAIFAPASGRLSDRMGSRGLATGGLIWMAVSLLVMSLIEVDTHYAMIVALLFSVGVGAAIFMTPNTAAVLRATPGHRVGVGSALIGEARSVGMALGIGITAAIVGTGLAGSDLMSISGALDPAEAQLFVDAIAPALMVAGVLALLAAAISWSRGPDAVDAQVEGDGTLS